MRKVTILFSSKLEKEALAMADFLSENGIPWTYQRFIRESGGAYDELLMMACDTPVIDASILPNKHPADHYIKGLEELKKNIDLLKSYIKS